MWSVVFWQHVLWSWYQGHGMPSDYLLNVTPFTVRVINTPDWLWGMVGCFLMLAMMVCQKLGPKFLRRTKNLPLNMLVQKSIGTMGYYTFAIAWCVIGLYALIAWFLGELAFKDIGYALLLWHTFGKGYVYSSVLGLFAGAAIQYVIARYYEPRCSKRIQARQHDTPDALSDIRQVTAQMAQPMSFDPERYFKEGQMFFGLNEQKKPIFVSWQQVKRAHIQIMGCTGSGKGVAAIALLAQAMQNGAATVVFEPKQGGDEWAPHVLKHLCDHHDKPFYLLDLQALVPQTNLLQDITPEQLDQLLQAGMGIEDKGGDSDYYRLKDRKAAREAAFLADKAQNFPHLLYLMQQTLQEFLTEADSFADKLAMLCQIPAVQTSQGLDLAKAIQEGACLYIIGSPDRAQIKLLQRMVLLRIKQLVEHRDRLQQHRHVTLFIDEVKYFLTRPVLDSLAMIRDHQCNVILAHQAPGDLYDVPKDVDGKACYACVTNNTNIKLIYKINDDRDRKMAAALTATKLVKRDSQTITTNQSMGEIIDTDKKLVLEVQVPLYDENYFAAMNERMGVLIGCGVAQLCFTAPIQVSKQPLKVQVYAKCPEYVNKKDDLEDMQPRQMRRRIVDAIE